MSHHDEELPSLDLAQLEHVTGGAGGGDSMMPMMMMMMMRGRSAPAAAPPPAAPATPKILLNGVEQRPTVGANGTNYTTNV